MLVSTDEGVVYTLRYGGPIFAEGDDLIVGLADDAEKKDEPNKKYAAKKPKATQENRFLMVTVSFDPTIIAGRYRWIRSPWQNRAGRSNIPDKPFAPDPNDPNTSPNKRKRKKKPNGKSPITRRRSPTARRKWRTSPTDSAHGHATPGESFKAINLDQASITQSRKLPARPIRQRPISRAASSPGTPPIRPP